MSSIDLYLYYGGEPCSDVTYGVTYEGPGKKIEIIQLKKGREINLKKLKKKIMKELDLDRRLHDIKLYIVLLMQCLITVLSSCPLK